MPGAAGWQPGLNGGARRSCFLGLNRMVIGLTQNDCFTQAELVEAGFDKLSLRKS